MRIDILTLFPEMFHGVLGSSILKRAADPDVVPSPVRYHLTDIRNYTTDKHGKVDAPPYGGGPGMVMRCQPIWDAVQAVETQQPELRPYRIVMTPQGRKLTHGIADALASEPRLLIIAGHYEGIDERLIEKLRQTGGVDEISIGDYVLSGGELPAMVLIDAAVRLLPGVLGDEDSASQDSFYGVQSLLDHPHYTRPPQWEGLEVPDVLLSGDHARIAAWRREQAEQRTEHRRPDLLDSVRPAIVTLRDEQKHDADAIDKVHRAAFPEDTEARLAQALRRREEAVISLVAQTHEQVVGHVVLSVVEMMDQPSIRGLLGLGPIAVNPTWQRKGIGSALVRRALHRAGDVSTKAVFLLGDPAYYGRFGFQPAAPLGFTGDYGDGPEFMVALLRGDLPAEWTGPIRFADAFREVGV